MPPHPAFYKLGARVSPTLWYLFGDSDLMLDQYLKGKSLIQLHSSKASILQGSAFFIVQFSHPYMTIVKTIALTRWRFVGKVMSLLFNMLSNWS